MSHRCVVNAAVAAAVLLVPAAAQARPVTVNLRIEGPTATVFEGRVTTDVRGFRFTAGDTAPHRCDGTAATGGTSTTPVPVRNGALVTAAEKHGFALKGAWSSFGPTFDQIGDQQVAFDPATNRYLVEYKNREASMLGGCSDAIAPGDDVLYAYGTGTEPLLKLTAPAKAKPGRRVTVQVTAGGKAVAGASVGSATTGADGRVTVRVPKAHGPFALKASKPGTIRSNRATVCVTDGRDGVSCPAVDTRAPRGRISSIRDGHRFATGHGPRVLAGRVARDRSGIADVQLRLTRTVGKRCQTYDARSERLVRIRRCGAGNGRWFSVGADGTWRYLLPVRLGRGRYVLDLRVADGAGNSQRKLRRGRTRVVFSVA